MHQLVLGVVAFFILSLLWMIYLEQYQQPLLVNSSSKIEWDSNIEIRAEVSEKTSLENKTYEQHKGKGGGTSLHVSSAAKTVSSDDKKNPRQDDLIKEGRPPPTTTSSVSSVEKKIERYAKNESIPLSNNGSGGVKASLFISTYITLHRDPAKQNYHRLDIFYFVLLTYAEIPWEEVHLYIKVENLIWGPKLERFARKLFGARLKTMQFYRLSTGREWSQVLLNDTFGKRFHDDYPIFISTNDDHPFIDENTDAILEGIELISNSKFGPWRTAYVIHWPEVMLYMASCAPKIRPAGKYWLRAKWNLFDGTMLTNLGYLRFIFSDGGQHLQISSNFTRIDALPPGGNGSPNFGNAWRRLPPPVLLFPLRELTRKFIAYRIHPTIPEKYLPPLKCPPEANIWPVHTAALIRRMSPKWTGWQRVTWNCRDRKTIENRDGKSLEKPRGKKKQPLRVPPPPEWITVMLKLTANFTGRPFEKYKGILNCTSAREDVQDRMLKHPEAKLEDVVAEMAKKFSGQFPVQIKPLKK